MIVINNENNNSLIRHYFPKGTDFRQVTDAKLCKVVKKLNERLEADATSNAHQAPR